MVMLVCAVKIQKGYTMSALPYASKLFSISIAIIQRVWQREESNLDAAAGLLTECIAAGGVFHVFGAGHSHLFAEEVSYRAGGLVPVNPILDVGYTLMGGPPSRSSELERLEGYVPTILNGYDLRPNEVMLIMSQSGRNAGPLEAALYAKEKGLRVVAVTSVAQSQAQTSRHSSGKRLFEIADVVIDNHVPEGDAAVELQPGQPRVAPLSTIVGAAILQALVAETAGRLLERGIPPPVWVSANVDGGEKHNLQMALQYQSRLRSF